MANSKSTVKTFERDLKTFIRNHPYLKEQQTKLRNIETNNVDKTAWEISTPDGEYESIHIQITKW